MPDQKKSNAEQAYDTLRALILKGQLSPGESLRLASLQEQFGFGATPLREALNRLSTENLVTNMFNFGYRVATLSFEELRDLDQTRATLEVEMLLDAIRNGSEDWEGRIVASHYQLSKLNIPNIGSDTREVDQWDKRHRDFHNALISGGRSKWMRALLDQIETQHRRYQRNIFLNAQNEALSHPDKSLKIDMTLAKVMGIEIHTSLMEAVLDRDEKAARTCLIEHIHLTSNAYKAVLALSNMPMNEGAKIEEQM